MDNVTLGVWHVLPYEILSDVIDNNDYNYDGILENGNYNILLYLHGNGADRASSLELYEILRKHFQILAIDYRGTAEKTELRLILKTLHFFKDMPIRLKPKWANLVSSETSHSFING